MLAYSVVAGDDFIDDDGLKEIIDGTIFSKYNIKNFVVNDFFHWVKMERNFRSLKKVFRRLAQEIATFDFNIVEEDVLKRVYQELIDLDTRHALGEYYTPDWLCERVVAELNIKKGQLVLDPSCGSGSFLRAAINHLKQTEPEISIEEICSSIYGIDIHPLSVQIAKTTFLLALGNEMKKVKSPVSINIILANTLLAPKGVGTLYGEKFKMTIDKEKYELDTQILDDMELFDDALEVCDELAEQTMHKKKETVLLLYNTLKRKNAKHSSMSVNVQNSFYSIYEGLKKVKESKRDSIWKFIMQNLYKPYFLADRFDFIIGNPPWFTYSNIKNEEYQDILNALAIKYQVKPDRVANFPHLEIAAIFMAYCSSYFLKITGKLAFVLPRSFFSSDHHDNTRSGKALGFKLSEVWDLEKVSPLFNVPSCVFFANKAINGDRYIPAKGIDGKIFSGRLPAHNCHLVVAEKKLTEKNVTWHYIKQGNSTALSLIKKKTQNKVNPYREKFKQGATIVPRTFYFVELEQDYPPDWDERIIHIKTSKEIKTDAKKPWKDLDIKGSVDSCFLYKTAISKSILPFALYKPDLIILPMVIETTDNIKTIKLYSAIEIMREGYSYGSKWFFKAEKFWEIYRTEKNKKISPENYLNWQNKLVSQNINCPYMVLYTASAKDANATIVKREDYDLEFIVESKTYVFYTEKLDEAYYLTAILNSALPNLLMKDLQTKGLFGARDIHKKILDIYYPLFDEKNKIHLELTKLSKQAHEKTAIFLKENIPTKTLTARSLGNLRLEIKKNLEKELNEMDNLVKKILM